MEVCTGYHVCLNVACDKCVFVGLKGMGHLTSQWVKPQCDGLSVLVGSVECVVQVREEHSALSAQVVLDVRVREASPVEQVRCRDADRVAGPSSAAVDGS